MTQIRWCYPVLNGAPPKRHQYSVQDGIGFLARAYYIARGMSHSGSDFNATSGGDSDLGDPIFAVSDGVVIAVGTYPGWGNIVLIEHKSAGVDSQYAHLLDYSVKVGDVVQMGQQIGRMGQGGRTRIGKPLYVSHLHFEIRFKRVLPQDWPASHSKFDSREQEEALVRESRVDPEAFLAKNNAFKSWAVVQKARTQMYG